MGLFCFVAFSMHLMAPHPNDSPNFNKIQSNHFSISVFIAVFSNHFLIHHREGKSIANGFKWEELTSHGIKHQVKLTYLINVQTKYIFCDLACDMWLFLLTMVGECWLRLLKDGNRPSFFEVTTKRPFLYW